VRPPNRMNFVGLFPRPDALQVRPIPDECLFVCSQRRADELVCVCSQRRSIKSKCRCTGEKNSPKQRPVHVCSFAEARHRSAPTAKVHLNSNNLQMDLNSNFTQLPRGLVLQISRNHFLAPLAATHNIHYSMLINTETMQYLFTESVGKFLC
jgi:hypothetical protein